MAVNEPFGPGELVYYREKTLNPLPPLKQLRAMDKGQQIRALFGCKVYSVMISKPRALRTEQGTASDNPEFGLEGVGLQMKYRKTTPALGNNLGTSEFSLDVKLAKAEGSIQPCSLQTDAYYREKDENGNMSGGGLTRLGDTASTLGSFFRGAQDVFNEAEPNRMARTLDEILRAYVTSERLPASLIPLRDELTELVGKEHLLASLVPMSPQEFQDFFRNMPPDGSQTADFNVGQIMVAGTWHSAGSWPRGGGKYI